MKNDEQALFETTVITSSIYGNRSYTTWAFFGGRYCTSAGKCRFFCAWGPGPWVRVLYNLISACSLGCSLALHHICIIDDEDAQSSVADYDVYDEYHDIGIAPILPNSFKAKLQEYIPPLSAV